MKINNNLISYLEDLSNLTLDDDEKMRLRGDLESILTGMEKLNEPDTDGVPERSHPFDNVNAFREDTVEIPAGKDLILKNAPRKNDEMIIAPKTVE